MKKVNAETNQENTGSLVAYKGFDSNLSCRDYQYEVGKTFIHNGPVVQCQSGFHVCENPLDVLDYYPIIDTTGKNNRFARVTIGGRIDRSHDNKWSAAKLTVSAELELPEFISSAVNFMLAFAKGLKGSKLAASGYYSQLAASGDYSKLAASGDYSQVAASGYSSKLAASGDYSKLAASGYYSPLAASGDYSQLAASGDYSQVAASGDYSQLAASGDYSKLAASGYSSKLAASGYYSQLAASGDYSQLAASGDYSKLAASGDYSQLAASGDYSKLAASGDYSQVAVSGHSSAAAAVGKGSTISAVDGTAIAICEYDDKGNPIGFVTGIVGKDGIEPDVAYRAIGGKLVAT